MLQRACRVGATLSKIHTLLIWIWNHMDIICLAYLMGMEVSCIDSRSHDQSNIGQEVSLFVKNHFAEELVKLPTY